MGALAAETAAPLPAAANDAAPASRSLLRFITCGSVDDGKSTLLGRLLYEAGAIPDDVIARLEADSARIGRADRGLDYSLLLDGLQAEREQGITIDVAYRYFSTARRAFIVADTDRGVDTRATSRMNFPLVHGYTPDEQCRAWLVSLGTFGFIGGTVVSKWVAIATLATASSSVAAGWLATECLVLLVLRQVVEGSWRFHLRGLDAALPSALVHLMFYIVSVAAPFPVLRFPGYLGPSLYCASVCYQTIASPLMLLVAFSMEGGSGLPRAELWAMLAVATVMLIVGASLMGCYMVAEYRKTFYQVMWHTE